MRGSPPTRLAKLVDSSRPAAALQRQPLLSRPQPALPKPLAAGKQVMPGREVGVTQGVDPLSMYLSPYLDAAPRGQAGRRPMGEGGVRVHRPSSATGGRTASSHRAPPARPASAKPTAPAHRLPPAPPSLARPSWDTSTTGTKTYFGTVAGSKQGPTAEEAAFSAANAALAAQLAGPNPFASNYYSDVNEVSRARDKARELKKLADHREGNQR